MKARLSRALLWLCFVLALVVLGTSSGLRLVTNGLGCQPWPQCYGAASGIAAAQPSRAAQAARLAHRIAASAFGLAATLAVVLGWSAWRRPARAAGVALLAVVAVLAVVGRHTPSILPAVTLTNVLGGLALVGGTTFLLAAQRAPTPTPAPPRWAAALLVALVALQAAAGTMVSVRVAGAACAQGCAAQRLTDLRLWHPLQAGPAAQLARGETSGEALHLLHRLVGVVIVAFAPALALAAAPRRTGGPVLIVALAACAGLGLALALFDGSLRLAIAHALSAGILVAALGLLLAGGSAREEIA